MSTLTQHGSVLFRSLAPRIYFSRHYEREGWMLMSLSLQSPVYRVNYMTRQIACFCEGDLVVYDCPSIEVMEREILDIHIFLVTNQCTKIAIDSDKFSVRYLDVIRFLSDWSFIEKQMNESSKIHFVSTFRDLEEDGYSPDIFFIKKLSFHQEIELAFYFRDDTAVPVIKISWSSVSGAAFDKIKAAYFAFAPVDLEKLKTVLADSTVVVEAESCHA